MDFDMDNYLEEKKRNIDFIFANPSSTKKLIMHGGCVRCISQSINGVGQCLGCMYCSGNGVTSGIPDLSLTQEQHEENEEKIYRDKKFEEFLEQEKVKDNKTYI